MSGGEKFLGSAERLYEKLAQNVVLSLHSGPSSIEAFKREQHQIIARWLRNFACHVLLETPMREIENIFGLEDARRVVDETMSDMTVDEESND